MKLYCNTMFCIVAGRLVGKKFVSQYKKNCIVTAGTVGCWTVSQHRATTRPARPRHGAGRIRRARGRAGRAGTARAGGRAGAQRAAGGRAGRVAGARGAGVAAGARARGALAWQQAHERAERARHRRKARGLCAQAGPTGPVGCELGFQPGFSTWYFS